MFRYGIAFGAPMFLFLLLLLPVLWVVSFRSLRSLGPVRRVMALLLRSLVMGAFIFALAEVQMVRTSEGLSVLYLLDQSMSIPVARRRAMIDYVNSAIQRHREAEDRVGVIVFGREAAIEIPPFNADVQMQPLIESAVDPEHTNVAGALRLAAASFPEGTAKRVVIVSDGNENLGSAMQQAEALAEGGVSIDVVPIHYAGSGELIVERVSQPSDVRRGQPFDLRIVTNNTNPPTEAYPDGVPARLVLRRWVGDQSTVVSEQEVTLPPGKQVYTVRQTLEGADFYRYEATLTSLSESGNHDRMRQNNRATASTHVRGKGRILLIEDQDNRGEYNRLADALRLQDLEVDVRPSDQLFSDLGELQMYDSVIIANVPRECFTEVQIDMLVANTQQLGAGLVMLGAPNCFGAGGWTNTAMEKAMPVDFQIKNAKIVPLGALAIIMHASEMAQGNFWQKKIGAEALNALGSTDYCGVVHDDFSSPATWLWKPGMAQVGNRRKEMLALIGRMNPGDMPAFDPGMKMALAGLNGVPGAAVKHMIIISDGDPSPPSNATYAALVRGKITVSTVAVATHGMVETQLMSRIATRTGGKPYRVTNPKNLPRIFQREARRVAQPLVYENTNGFQPTGKFFHEMLSGVDSVPPMSGYVLTSRKDNPLVEVCLTAPEPGAERNSTLLAGWTYGLGKTVAFTSDAGVRYTKQWPGWEGYDKFFSQIVRWSMRPVGEEGNFTVATSPVDGKVQVVVTALDKEDEFLNFLAMSATAIDPDMKAVPLNFEQTAPGRYVGSFDGNRSGSYFVMIQPGQGSSPIRTGVNVPYSEEFRGRPTNDVLLEQLAMVVPKGGTAGKLIQSEDGSIEGLLPVNSFRRDLPKAKDAQDIWFLAVLLGSCLFFGDIFLRRVQVNFAWIPALATRLTRRLFGHEEPTAEPATIDRLRSRKAEMDDRIEQLRAATRFEVPEGGAIELEDVTDDPAPPRESTLKKDKSAGIGEATREDDSYTARLLKAKQEVREQRERDGGQ